MCTCDQFRESYDFCILVLLHKYTHLRIFAMHIQAGRYTGSFEWNGWLCMINSSFTSAHTFVSIVVIRTCRFLPLSTGCSHLTQTFPIWPFLEPHNWVHVRMCPWCQRLGRLRSSSACSGVIIHLWAQEHSHGLGFSPCPSLPQHHHAVILGSQRDILPWNEYPSQICHHHPHCWGNLQHIHGLSGSRPRHTVLPHGQTELLWHWISVSGIGGNLTLLFFRAIGRRAVGGNRYLLSPSFVPRALHKAWHFICLRFWTIIQT